MNAKTEPGQIDSQVIDNFSLGLPTGVTKHTLVPERFIFIVRSTRLDWLCIPCTDRQGSDEPVDLHREGRLLDLNNAIALFEYISLN